MIIEEGMRLIRKSELGPNGRPALKAYLCPAGIWTIGYGHTGPEVVKGYRLASEEVAEQLLRQDVEVRERQVLQLCKVRPTPAQLAAMTSLLFNIGLGDPKTKRQGFRSSSVLRLHNQGNPRAAAKAFALWNKATVDGKLVVLPGLVTRRAEEAALYLSDLQEVAEPADARHTMPQEVAPPPSALQDPDVRKGLGTAASAAAPLSETLRSASDIAWSTQPLIDTALQLGPWVLLTLVILGFAGYFIWRYRQKRKNGEA